MFQSKSQAIPQIRRKFVVIATSLPKPLGAVKPMPGARFHNYNYGVLGIRGRKTLGRMPWHVAWSGKLRHLQKVKMGRISIFGKRKPPQPRAESPPQVYSIRCRVWWRQAPHECSTALHCCSICNIVQFRPGFLKPPCNRGRKKTRRKGLSEAVDMRRLKIFHIAVIWNITRTIGDTFLQVKQNGSPAGCDRRGSSKKNGATPKMPLHLLFF